jgi:hypothetical protein
MPRSRKNSDSTISSVSKYSENEHFFDNTLFAMGGVTIGIIVALVLALVFGFMWHKKLINAKN